MTETSPITRDVADDDLIVTSTSLEQCLEAIAALAEHAGSEGYYGLQDVGLLMIEACSQLSTTELLSAPLQPELARLPILFAEYLSGAPDACLKISHTLSLDGWQLGLLPEELEQLNEQLVNECPASLASVTDVTIETNADADFPEAVEQAEILSLEQCLHAITASTNTEKPYYGLQDVASLLVEACSPLAEELLSAELLTQLNCLPAIFTDYLAGSTDAAMAITSVLGLEELQLGLLPEELEQLTAQLISEISPDVDVMAEDLLDSVFVEENLLGDGEFDEPELVIDLLASADVEENLHVDADFNEPELAMDLLADDDWLMADTSIELGNDVAEFLELLIMEATLIEQRLSATDSAGLQQIIEDLQRFIDLSQTAGFHGLALICGHVDANIRCFTDSDIGFTESHQAILSTWIANVKSYLDDVEDTQASMQLLAQLGVTDWPLELDMNAAAAILMQLQGADADSLSNEAEQLKQIAEPEDVSLALPNDVNQELLNILLQELPVQTQQFSSAIQNLQNHANLADLEIAQRVAHTVKGAANTVGIKGIAQLTHYLEDILVICSQAKLLPTSALLNVLIDAADCLEAMTEAVTAYMPAPPDAINVLQNVLDWANKISSQDFDLSAICVAPGAAVTVTTSVASIDLDVNPQTDDAPEITEKQQANFVRVAAEQLDELFRAAGENIIFNTQANERLKRMKNHLQAMEKQFQLLRNLADELEQLVDLKDLAGKFLNQESAFDTLEMDQYSELHTASRRMVEAAFDARELSLDTGRELEEMGRLLEDQQRLVNETQETIMKTRLVPVSSISQRLQRSLRQTSRLTGKQCQLQVSGEHLLVDGDTLNNLIDPLMHLLRNAVDHGIEDEDSRIALGKPAHGNIAISFDRDGNNIVVRIQDDGKGLDYAAIRAAAERRGAIAPDQQVSEDDLKRLILKPNFSTRTQTTQTSGRGVGMDVVHHQVLTQGGTLTLQSEYGKGLDVAMSIPLPLSRAHALLTHIGPYQVAVSSKGIKQILFVAADALSLHDGRYYLQLQDDNYPAVYLANLMNISVPDRSAKKLHTVLLVQNNEQITAVLLDAITDSLDVIIKSLGHYIKKIPGYTGAAIMGDGSVAPVLDLPELIRTADASLYANQDLSDDSFIASPASHLPTVLVVDDSLSQRRALEQLLEDAGFQVKTARDGMDAADQLVEFIPDIVLTDLEMPRMNGLELATHIRSRENIKHLPVIMITSRTTQAHRKLAEEAGINAYLVKPVREDDLLENIQMALATPAMA